MAMRYKNLHAILSILLALLCCLFPIFSVQAQSIATVSSYGIPTYHISPELVQSTLTYLNHSYRHATELDYGSERDKAQIYTISNQICKNCTTPQEKANAIAKWTKWHIRYENPVQKNSHFALNVYQNQSGQCMGFAEFMRQMMRAQRIPTVLVVGIQEDTTLLQIKDVSRAMQKGLWHAFVMSYYDGTWHLFDPIHRFYDLSNPEDIARHFLIGSVEGVAPTILSQYPDIFGTNRIVYHKGQSYAYARKGKWYSSYYVPKTLELPGTNINQRLELIGVPYLSTLPAKYVHSSETYPKKNELFSNGWFLWNHTLYHAKANGILYTNCLQQYQGHWYYLDSLGEAISCPPSLSQSSTWEGLPLIQTGTEVTLKSNWDKELRGKDWTITYNSSQPSVAEVTNQGLITALTPGTTLITATAKKGNQTISSMFSIHTINSQKSSFFIPYIGKRAGLIIQPNQKQSYLYQGGHRRTDFTGFYRIGKHYYYVKKGCWKPRNTFVWANQAIYRVHKGIVCSRLFHKTLGL